MHWGFLFIHVLAYTSDFFLNDSHFNTYDVLSHCAWFLFFRDDLPPCPEACTIFFFFLVLLDFSKMWIFSYLSCCLLYEFFQSEFFWKSLSPVFLRCFPFFIWILHFFIPITYILVPLLLASMSPSFCSICFYLCVLTVASWKVPQYELTVCMFTIPSLVPKV